MCVCRAEQRQNAAGSPRESWDFSAKTCFIQENNRIGFSADDLAQTTDECSAFRCEINADRTV